MQNLSKLIKNSNHHQGAVIINVYQGSGGIPVHQKHPDRQMDGETATHMSQPRNMQRWSKKDIGKGGFLRVFQSGFVPPPIKLVALKSYPQSGC